MVFTILIMDETEKPLRVFLPVQVRWANSGYLIGCLNLVERTCCVTGIIHSDNVTIKQRLDMTDSQSGKLAVIGYLENLSMKDSISSKTTKTKNEKQYCSSSERVWLQIKNRDCEVTNVQFLGAWKTLRKGSFVIYYDPSCITKSAFIGESVYKTMSTSESEIQSIKGNIDFVIYSLQIHNLYGAELVKSNLEMTPCPRTSYKMPVFPTNVFKGVMTSGIGVLDFCNRLLSSCSAWKICNKPAVLCQSNYRWKVIEGAVHDAKGTPFDRLRCKNAISQQLFDHLLGIIIMFYLLQADYHEVFADHIMSSADWIASELQVLLKWMMGFPAGLKLNSQLDSFLGRFFLYHIYLWIGYLQVLRPVLSTFLWYIFVSGCFGVTTQLCLIQDLISMMTLHIYCFYVYAARLYDIQMYGLASLWRLFRGKKWNVLRKRIDTASFDVDQLFLGTLLFTILLFLLPTTALYYIVFTALRLVVLIVQGSLHKVVSLLNVLPLQSYFSRIFSPETVSDGVYFTVHSPCQVHVPLSMNVELVPASLMKLWKHSTSIRQQQTYSWKNLGHKLYWGKLIYPWIESQS